MGPEGLELPPESSGETAIPKLGGAESGALPPPDPRLARLIESWPDLPEAVRAGIAAMVGASDLTGGEGASDA
ncbi:MAG: hypothetical protein ACI89L_001353 [Phycisphaerales bacterium]|jgi:hypothetical protein